MCVEALWWIVRISVFVLANANMHTVLQYVQTSVNVLKGYIHPHYRKEKSYSLLVVCRHADGF